MGKKEKKLSVYFLILVIILSGILLYHPFERSLQIYFLDVGQGDGIFIQTPSAHTYLIDGGSTNVKKIGKYRIEPFLKSKGIKKIDYMMISHMDQDHINGLMEMLEHQKEGGISIKNVILPDTQTKDVYQEVVELVSKKRITLHYMGQGEGILNGEVSLEILYPRKGWVGEPGNESSLVVYLKYGSFTVLFTGDIEGRGEEELLLVLKEKWRKETLPLTVLKVAHHGSKYSTKEEVLELLKPKIAVISSGEGNLYHHPHKELIQRLEEENSIILRTDTLGAIWIEQGKKEGILGSHRRDKKMKIK